MAKVVKIDSNKVSVAYAEEESRGVLPGSPAWKSLGPNSYSDFGPTLTTITPNPINDSRQREKGVITDLEASGGMNHDLNFYNLQDLLQGFIFASTDAQLNLASTSTTSAHYVVASGGGGFVAGDIVKGEGFANAANNTAGVVTASTATTVVRAGLVAETGATRGRIRRVGHRAGSADLSVNVSGSLPVLVSDGTIDFTDWDLQPGQFIFIGGDATDTSFTNAANNGLKRVRSVTATQITLDKSDQEMVTDAGTGKTIEVYFGDCLKNKSGTDQITRSYHIERLLGAPDDASPAALQSEVLKGAHANEFSLSIPTAGLVQADLSFVAFDAEQRTSVQGPLQSSVVDPLPADVFNTSSDFARTRLALVSSSAEAPEALFAYAEEMSITVNNNLQMNKAIGIIGGFGVSVGDFQVSGDLTVYFADVQATKAVRDNADVTFDVTMVKDNKGITIDLPLITLSDARPNIEPGQPVKLPITMDAARGRKVAESLDHTIAFTFFHYLPNAAD